MQVKDRRLETTFVLPWRHHTFLFSMNTFSIGGDDMYCTTHYKQAFTEKGTYDVFTPNKGKWTRKIEATNSESSKSQE